MANFVSRFKNLRRQISTVQIRGKMAGAVGNYNAHYAAYPDVPWDCIAEEFVTSLGIGFNPYVTQIEPRDYMTQLFNSISHFNDVLLGFDQDMWSYISLGYFRQQPIVSEVGSSTMPHKVSPIDFENSEGNLEFANAILQHLSSKLCKSRMQRDLSDSTVIRNLGVGLGHSIIAYGSTLKGLKKLKVDKIQLLKELGETWEVVAEAIQTILKKHKVKDPYEQLKEFTRGCEVTRESLELLIESMDVSKNELLKLAPDTYVGHAERLAKRVIEYD